MSYGVPTPDSTLSQQNTMSPQANPGFENWITAPLRLNVGPLERNDPYSTVMQVDQMDQTRDYPDWRQLFSFTDSDLPVPMAMEGLMELEDEWRQIYWQDTPMTDLMQDGGWIPGG
jgi:transcriptional regulatory protein AMDR